MLAVCLWTGVKPIKPGQEAVAAKRPCLCGRSESSEPKGTNPSARPGNIALSCYCEAQTRQGCISSFISSCNVSADPILQMFSSKWTWLYEYFSNYQAVAIEMSKKTEPLNRISNCPFHSKLTLNQPVGCT